MSRPVENMDIWEAGYRAGRADAEEAEMELNEFWLRRYAELHRKHLIATCPWCVCEEGPYFGAQKVGTPLRCERCGHDESESD